MEIFVDFGLFELLAVLGIAGAARMIYSRVLLGLLCVGVSLLAPIALLFVVHGELARWLAAVGLGTSLVNGAVVLGALQSGSVRVISLPKRRANRG